jgi:hypothetical protein
MFGEVQGVGHRPQECLKWKGLWENIERENHTAITTINVMKMI